MSGSALDKVPMRISRCEVVAVRGEQRLSLAYVDEHDAWSEWHGRGASKKPFRLGPVVSLHRERSRLADWRHGRGLSHELRCCRASVSYCWGKTVKQTITSHTTTTLLDHDKRVQHHELLHASAVQLSLPLTIRASSSRTILRAEPLHLPSLMTVNHVQRVLVNI